jgi:hypothetical protein
MVARSDRAGTNQDNLTLEFNADSTNSYAYHELSGDGTSVTSSALTSRANIILPPVAGASSTTSAFGAQVIDILDPFETSKNTTTRTLGGGHFTGGGAGAGRFITLLSGLYFKTDAITSMKIDQFAGSNFVTGSRFSLYGIKAV